jgi:hypothetical protein
MALLTLYGWLAGRAAQLQGVEAPGRTSIAAGPGVAMTVLADLVLILLH